MSSLLQVPFAQQLIGPKKQVGILCYQRQFLTEAHLQNVGIVPDSNFVIAGASDDYQCTELDRLWNWEVRPERPEAVYQIQENRWLMLCEHVQSESRNRRNHAGMHRDAAVCKGDSAGG